MPLYRFTSGKHHSDGKVYRAGDTIELSEESAGWLQYKLEPADEPTPAKAPPKPEPTEPDEPLVDDADRIDPDTFADLYNLHPATVRARIRRLETVAEVVALREWELGYRSRPSVLSEADARIEELSSE